MVANATELVVQAEKKLTPGGFCGFLGGGPKYLEAQDLYQLAANKFKLAKEWQEAADCLAKCTECAKNGGSASDESNFLMEAGNVLKKISTAKAVEQYEKAIAIFNANGHFQQSGKLLVSVAELYENERLNHKETKECYQRASELFELDEHSKTSHSKCILKVAEFAAKDGEIDKAIKIFEAEGEKSLQNSLLQFNAKDHFFRAGILHLANGDGVTVNLAVEKYRALDPRFAGSREGELLSNLAEVLESKDVELFTDKLVEFDSVTPLDAWKTEFLVKVKELITGPALGELDLS